MVERLALSGLALYHSPVEHHGISFDYFLRLLKKLFHEYISLISRPTS